MFATHFKGYQFQYYDAYEIEANHRRIGEKMNKISDMKKKDEVLEQAADWQKAGREVALATVVETWGSAPRVEGSQLAVNADGTFVGSVSGGCIEGAVVKEALETLEKNAPRLLKFTVSNEQAWDVGLTCGGEVSVFVEPAPDTAVLEELINKRPLARISDLKSGKYALIEDGEVSGELKISDDLIQQARQALSHDSSTRIGDEDHPLFIHALNPNMRMVVIGGVHIAQALAPLARAADIDVTVVDPRSAFANDVRFDDVPYIVAWPDEGMEELDIDSRTAVVVLSHDKKIDDPALTYALKSDAFYIGALGGSKNHGRRLKRLKEQGFTDEELARIHGPIGYDIGAKTPAEIAVSILAQVIAAKHGKETHKHGKK